MKVVRREGGEYPDCIVKYFNFDKYSVESEDKVFFWGWRCFEDSQVKKEYSHYKHRIFLDTASPCGLYSSFDFIEKATYFTKFYTICPVTAVMLNMNGVNAEAVCFPYPNEELDQISNSITQDIKKYDSIYYGQVHDQIYKRMIQTIARHNHRFTTISYHGIDQELVGLITDLNVNTRTKWAILGLSKSCVGINLLFTKSNPYAEHYIKNYNISDEVGEMLTDRIMPQMKTRMVESAACKTLMLLYRDKYKVVENWFEPDKHFVYWDDYEHLEYLINDLKKNYDKYWNIVEEANNHVKQYSISSFWSKINE